LVFIWGISGFVGSQMVKKQPFEKFIQIDDPATVRHGDELQLSMMANVDSTVEIFYGLIIDLFIFFLINRKQRILLQVYVGQINGSLW
jgi:hypothetical protein